MIFDDWYVAILTVKTLTGTDEHGVQTFTATTISGQLENQSTLVRSADGTEVVSSAQLYAALSDWAKVPPGSRISLPDREATVITRSSGEGDPDLDGITVHLT